MRLESVAEAAWAQGITATVFNCPEIRTNSSDIFVGVELSLFPLLKALKKEGGGAWADQQWAICQELLDDGVSLQSLLDHDRGLQQRRHQRHLPQLRRLADGQHAGAGRRHDRHVATKSPSCTRTARP